ncbi:hypothetical protein [Glycomyces tarimensis]
MGLFGAIGRETKGAIRSIGYDVRRSKRFRRLGVLAVATVAGGVMTTGVLMRSPVPEYIGLQSEEEGSGVTDGWFGFGSDTQGQDAEPESSPAASGGADTESPSEAAASTEPGHTAPGGGGATNGQAGAPAGAPGLTPIEKPTGDTPPESDTAEPSPGSPEPSEAPTTPEPSPSETPTETPSPTKSPSQEPTASKTPIDE